MGTITTCDSCGKEALGSGYLESWIRIESYFHTSFYNYQLVACSPECAKVCVDNAIAEVKRRQAISASTYT